MKGPWIFLAFVILAVGISIGVALGHAIDRLEHSSPTFTNQQLPTR